MLKAAHLTKMKSFESEKPSPIKVCLLSHRKFDRIQEGSSGKKNYAIETKCFCKTQEIS